MGEKSRQQWQELYDREEICAKAIRTLIRSLALRLLVLLLLVFACFWQLETNGFLVAVAILVVAVDLGSAVPLAKELKKQMEKMKELRRQEEC